MAINKSLNIGVKRAYKQGDWLGFTAVEVIPKELRNNADISDWGKAGKIINRIEALLKTEGFKINELIEDTILSDQIRDTTNKRSDAQTRINETRKLFESSKSDTQRNHLRDHEVEEAALGYIVQAMLKEQALRDAINLKIEVAKREDTLDAWNKIKNDWRSIEQKTTINDNIKRVEKVLKESEEAAKVEAAKQAKLNELNNKMATTTDPNEKKAIAAQIGALMGSVSTETGMPKGVLYIGIGVAVVVGIWITLRAIRK